MEDKRSVIGTLRQKAKLFRSSRVGSIKHPNKPEVREESLLDQRMRTSKEDVPHHRTSSSLSHSHQQPANLRPSSFCKPPTPPNMNVQRRGAVTGLADSLNMPVDSKVWPSQESDSDGAHEEQDFFEASENMEQMLKLGDTQVLSPESVTEVMLISQLNESCRRKEVFNSSTFYCSLLLRLCYTNIFLFGICYIYFSKYTVVTIIYYNTIERLKNTIV